MLVRGLRARLSVLPVRAGIALAASATAHVVRPKCWRAGADAEVRTAAARADAQAVGKSLAMEMILANRWLDADEALRHGLVSKVLPADDLLPESLKLARSIASYSQPAARLAKECVNSAYESPLQEGLRLERRNFHATFALADQKEGMSAFAEKRTPTFTNT